MSAFVFRIYKILFSKNEVQHGIRTHFFSLPVYHPFLFVLKIRFVRNMEKIRGPEKALEVKCTNIYFRKQVIYS